MRLCSHIMGRRPACCWPILFVAVLTLISCGISGEYREQATQAGHAIARATEAVQQKETRYADLKTGSDFSFFDVYAKRENWRRHFTLAREKLATARSINDGEIARILKKNDRDDEPLLARQINAVQVACREALSMAGTPFSRMDQLVHAKEEADELFASARGIGETAAKTVAGLAPVLASAEADYPDRRAQIDRRYLPVREGTDKMQAAAEMVDKQYQAHRNDAGADYAYLLDNARFLQAEEKTLLATADRFQEQMGELSRSYVKILDDMKEEARPWVKTVRYEWDERMDWDTTRQTGTRMVSVSDAEFEIAVDRLRQSPDGFIVRRGYGWEEVVEEADQDFSYFHKYTMVEDDVVEKTDWQPVTEAFYEQNEENLGMEIVSKPFGAFEDEVIETAAPPGMNLVGNPRYGKWDDNQTPGNRSDDFWVFYGKYRFFTSLFGYPGGYFGYRDWSGWNRDYRGRRPYYGTGTGGERRWGSGGTVVRNSSRYQDTHHARSGGLQKQTPSVRGASVRGGGPGGRGK